MRLSKTEVNLRRLIAAAPQQQNLSKLIHYVATLRELLEELAAERTPEGLPRSCLIPKATLSDYSEKIELIASRLAPPLPEVKISRDVSEEIEADGSPKTEATDYTPQSPGLRRRHVLSANTEERIHDNLEEKTSSSVKLDVASQANIEKHRKLQDSLTNEMVELAQQLKESSLVMSQSLKNTEKILDSTEKAVEHSLASTGHANVRALEIYSTSSETTCFTWLLIFVMTCVFVMVVLLIRVT